MNTDIREGDRSTVVLEVQITDKELQNAINEGVRHLARRTRIPGFRPGKAPRSMIERALGIDRSDPEAPDPVYDEAREHLYQRTVVKAVADSGKDVLELPREPEWTQFEEGVGAAYEVTLPVRPEVQLGDYTEYPFTPEVSDVDDEQVEQVIQQLREQQASLVPVEGRSAQVDDYVVISFEGRLDGEPVEGAKSERFPLIIGKERMIPGFETNLLGMEEDEERTFSVTFPEDYAEEPLQGKEVEFTARLLELRERRLPDVDDDFAGLIGPYDGMAALREDLRKRMEVSALDRARHGFIDRIIDYATANATVALPDVLVEREVGVMIDELRVRVAEQGIAYEDYLRVTEKDEAAMREEYREGAEKRVKVLLVLGAIADKEEVTVSDEEVQAEIDGVNADPNAGDPIKTYLASDRGRSYIRSQLRRSQVIELLADRWIEAHPEFERVQHQHGHRHDEDEAPADAVAEAVEELTHAGVGVEGEDEA
ncbi:MAG TPA: trigger factor [Anaerolineae bacterium]|nr:trigger factor [Anaerolineae bacterium]